MVWRTDNRRREFLKLAAWSLAGLTTTAARGMGQDAARSHPAAGDTRSVP